MVMKCGQAGVPGGCTGKLTISHCAGKTPVTGGSECHAEQCHMVYTCSSGCPVTYGGCGVVSHHELIRATLSTPAYESHIHCGPLPDYAPHRGPLPDPGLMPECPYGPGPETLGMEMAS